MRKTRKKECTPMKELDSLREELLEGRVDRRTFVQKALALGISLPAASVLLSAWGRGLAGVAHAASYAAPKRGGILKFARNFEPVTLGPFGAADNGTIWTIMMIYDQLVEYQPGTLDPQPGLAKSWEFKNGGKTIVFHLRDAKFSDGSPVTAADVKFSLDRFKDPKVNNLLPFLATSIASIQAPNPKTVVMKLKRTDGAILSNLTVFPASITPKAVVTKLGDKAFALKPVGSGPFVVDQWARGQFLKMSRNTHHWRAGKPYLDGVEFDYITNDNTRILKLQSGEVDVAESIPFSQVDALNKGNTRVEVAPLASIDAIWLNNTHKPFDEKLVRQALNYATDKNAINRVVYFGHAQVANGIFPFFKYTDTSVHNYPYDINKAKALLAKSSVPKGFDVTILIPSEDQTKAQMMAVVKQLWAQIGVNVTIQSLETNTLFTKYMNGDYQASDPLPSITADVLVPDELALAWLDPTGVQKGFWSFYKSKEAWKLTLEANSTTDEAKRKKIFGQMQRETLADAPWVPLFFVPARTGLSASVQNFHTLESGWWNLWEVWKS
jgi:peptide/nickel transport system substrate-binding protein